MRDGSSTVTLFAARSRSLAVVTVMRQIQVENAASPRKLRIAVASLTQTSCDVFRLRPRAADPPGKPVYAVVMALDQRRERRPAPARRLLRQCLIVHPPTSIMPRPTALSGMRRGNAQFPWVPWKFFRWVKRPRLLASGGLVHKSLDEA